MCKMDNSLTLSQLINVNQAVMLYFYNNSCPPCVALRPKVDDMLAENYPLITRYFIEAEANPQDAADFGVFASPTIIVFFEGKEFKRFSKYISVNELSAALERPYSLLFSE